MTRAPRTWSPTPTIRLSTIASLRSAEYKIVPSTASNGNATSGGGAGFIRAGATRTGTSGVGSRSSITRVGGATGARFTTGAGGVSRGFVVAAGARFTIAGGGATTGGRGTTGGGAITAGGLFTTGGGAVTTGALFTSSGGAVTTGALFTTGDGAVTTGVLFTTGGVTLAVGAGPRPRAGAFTATRATGGFASSR